MVKIRAFLVEDSPIILETLSAALEEVADVRVVGSASGEKEALAWFDARTDGCNIAAIDPFLASGSGLGVLEGMQAFAPLPHRVVLTNYATPHIRSVCAALGAEKVFDKSNLPRLPSAGLDFCESTSGIAPDGLPQSTCAGNRGTRKAAPGRRRFTESRRLRGRRSWRHHASSGGDLRGSQDPRFAANPVVTDDPKMRSLKANSTIEQTFQRPLRALRPAAHAER